MTCFVVFFELQHEENTMLLDAQQTITKFDKFCNKLPAEETAFSLFPDAWKFKFDKMTQDEIISFLLTIDGRPKMCSNLFNNFSEFNIIEFGPSDGYNTAQLEMNGAKFIKSIESNIEAFLRCLIIKNFLNLNCRFLLGDFLKFFSNNKEIFDLAYASGVIYHLEDPVEFIINCGKMSKNIFIWSLYYDDASINNDKYETKRFLGCEEIVKLGIKFTYYKRSVDDQFLNRSDYQGGIVQCSSWLTLDGIISAVELAGFKVLKTLPDKVGNIPAINLWAKNTNIIE